MFLKLLFRGITASPTGPLHTLPIRLRLKGNVRGCETGAMVVCLPVLLDLLKLLQSFSTWVLILRFGSSSVHHSVPGTQRRKHAYVSSLGNPIAKFNK